MKREYVALVVILSILGFSIFNARYVKEKTTQFQSELYVAQLTCQGGDQEKALQATAISLGNWLKWHKYAHIMLRHSEVDDVTDSYYELLDALENSNRQTPDAAFGKVGQKLQNIADMEQMTFGSIL